MLCGKRIDLLLCVLKLFVDCVYNVYCGEGYSIDSFDLKRWILFIMWVEIGR